MVMLMLRANPSRALLCCYLLFCGQHSDPTTPLTRLRSVCAPCCRRRIKRKAGEQFVDPLAEFPMHLGADLGSDIGSDGWPGILGLKLRRWGPQAVVTSTCAMTARKLPIDIQSRAWSTAGNVSISIRLQISSTSWVHRLPWLHANRL